MKKAWSMILLSTILLSAVSCGDTQKESTDRTSEADTTETMPSVETVYTPNIEPVDYGGAEFTILTRLTDSYTRQLDDISAEEENGTPLNDEIFKRNSRIMNKYNVEFTIISDGNVSSKLRSSVSADDDAYQLVFNGISDHVALSAEGFMYDLAELPHLDMTQPYWSNDLMDDISIYNKYYVGVSNLTIQAFFSSGIIYFNKDLATTYGIEDPYALVRDGQWTFDKMTELCRNVSADLDGNNVFDEKDQYGITFNNFGWQILYYGSGEPFVKKDTQGSLYLDSQNERMINFLQKLMPISQDSEVVLYSENFRNVGGEYRITVCQNAFNESRALFWLEAMYGVPTLRNMDKDFGILPVPKVDIAQKEYASFIHTAHGSSVAVPITVRDTDRVGRILEDLTYDSADVREAFIETTLKGKYTRDDDSSDMIDIIINNIRTDYALLLNTYGLSLDADMRTLMNSGSTEISSLFASKSESYNAAIDKYNSAMKGLD